MDPFPHYVYFSVTQLVCSTSAFIYLIALNNLRIPSVCWLLRRAFPSRKYSAKRMSSNWWVTLIDRLMDGKIGRLMD